jgi:pentapeptide MXKDX repeat protein
MSTMIYRLIAMCLLSVSLTLFAQSSDSIKQEQSQPNQMKHDDGMKHDDSMKHDDQMKHGDKPNHN